MIAAVIAIYALYAFIGLLLVRMIIGWVMVFAPNFRPTGLVAALLELAYSVTDPPLKALDRVLPPLRLGRTSLNLGFIVVYIVCYALITVLSRYA